MTAPSRIGSYPIERELGRGGMGIVYLGRDPRLGRPVAIKVLPDAFAQDPERLSRFEREAQLLASLSHPNIAGIYGLEEADGHRLLALEYVEGETLADRIARAALPVQEALEIARQIAAALEAAHESGVIHRDLKPANIKLTPAGDVKVLDFGLARGAGSAASSPDLSQSPTMTYAVTGVGVILGTAAYMSPEQARGKVVDRRTDIWSFGCVLYEMLTGRQLFSGETVSDTIARILEREPDWSAIPAAVPEKIRELLRRCLEKDARKRLRDIGDARVELEEIISSRASKTPVAKAGDKTAGRTPRWAYIVTAAALAQAVLALALLGMMKQGSMPQPMMRLSVIEPEGAHFISDPMECALSPDGRTLAFVAADSAGTVQLWSRPLDALDGRPVPGTDNASMPFWSPDSRWIAFFADGKLKKVRPRGGVETLCEAQDGRGGSWSRDGTIVFAPLSQGPIFAVDAAGGEPRPLTTLDSSRHETSHRFPSALPDGKHFLYVVLPGGSRGFQVMSGSLDGHKGRPVLTADSAPVYAEPGYLIFLRNGTLVTQRFDPRSLRLQGDPLDLHGSPPRSQTTGLRVATVSSTGSLAYMEGGDTNDRLTWYDRAGHPLGVVSLPGAQYWGVELSPDDRTAAVTRRGGPNESDVLLVDLARGVPTRFTHSPSLNQWIRWSHDGSQIAFESNRKGTYDIYLKPANGSRPESLLVGGRSQFKHPGGWSADDRLLVFSELNPGTGFDIWYVPTDGSGPPVPYLQTTFNEHFPTLSPDGRWLLYASDESGRYELYVQSFPNPDHKFQVTTTGCWISQWGKDGKEIFAGAQDGQVLLSAEVLESGARFRAGAPRTLFRMPLNAEGMAASRDGQRFLIAVPEARTVAPSITVMLNWKAVLAAGSDDRR